MDGEWLLTERESQVIEYLARGHSCKYVAIELGIAASTVATHVRCSLRKLGLRHRIELILHLSPDAGVRHADDALTPAERAVLEMIVEACSNAEIARRRRTSVRTVANQVASIFRKHGVASRGELITLLARRSSQCGDRRNSGG